MSGESITEAEALAYLNADGDLGVPCSRYGRSTFECSPVAWRAALAYADATGDPITCELLGYLMGLTVNDHDDIAHLIGEGES